MVGGLVHEDDVRLLQQQLRQRKAGALAAGKGGDQPLMHFGLQTETVQHPEHLAFVGIALLGVVAFGQPLILGGKAQRRFGVGGFQQRFNLGHAALHGADGLKYAEQSSPDRIGQGNIVQLGQIAHAKILIAVDRAAVRLHLSGNQAHEGRLAAAVDPDKAHFFPFLQAEGDAAEDFMDTEALLKLLNGNENHKGQAFL